MDTHHSSTAIVLFARRADSEVFYKTLLTTKKKNLRLHEELIQTSKAVAEISPCSFIHIHEDFQEGETFGERISNCTRSIFDRGFSRIILIGGDCPDLSIHDINEALISLDSNKLAIGPDSHGGTYLIGFSKDQFDLASFQKLSWNKSTFLRDLKNYALEFSEVTLLSEKTDLNSSQDVLINARSSQALKDILSRIFIDLFTGFQPKARPIVTRLIHDKNRRGPPALA